MNSSPSVEPKRPKSEYGVFPARCIRAFGVTLGRKGADKVTAALGRGAAMSAVNEAEVAARLHVDGWSAREVAAVFSSLNIEILPLDTEAAPLSGQYRPDTKKPGLSLGDRACMATGQIMKLPVLTADQVWMKIKILGLKIECIR